MSLTAHLLLNKPTRLPVGTTIYHGMDKKPVAFQTAGMRTNLERMEAIRLENIERIFDAVQRGHNTKASVSENTGISDMTALRAIHQLQHDGRIKITKVGRLHVYEVIK